MELRLHEVMIQRVLSDINAMNSELHGLCRKNDLIMGFLLFHEYSMAYLMLRSTLDGVVSQAAAIAGYNPDTMFITRSKFSAASSIAVLRYKYPLIFLGIPKLSKVIIYLFLC